MLEFIPARFELHVHVLPKYACSHCRDGVVAPEGPAASLERLYRWSGRAGRGGRLQVRRTSAALSIRGYLDSLRAVFAAQHALRLGPQCRRSAQAALRA